MSLEVYTDDEARERANARAKISQAANRGEPPHAYFAKADLDWAFEGHEEMLTQLAETAAEIQANRQRADEQRARRNELTELTRAVLKEWDEAAKRERYRQAGEEAKRRMGWEG